VSTREGLLVHRATVHSVDATTKTCQVRIPSLLGGQVISIDSSLVTPAVGDTVIVYSPTDLSEFFAGGSGGGGRPVPLPQTGAAPPTPTAEGLLWWDTADTSLDTGVDVDGGSPASTGTTTIDCGPP